MTVHSPGHQSSFVRELTLSACLIHLHLTRIIKAAICCDLRARSMDMAMRWATDLSLMLGRMIDVVPSW